MGSFINEHKLMNTLFSTVAGRWCVQGFVFSRLCPVGYDRVRLADGDRMAVCRYQLLIIEGMNVAFDNCCKVDIGYFSCLTVCGGCDE
jgi:hypothetical protein